MIKERLKTARETNGLSQEQLADKIGMTQSNYSRRENGLKNISNSEWDKIAKELNVKVEDIKQDDIPNVVYKNIKGNSFNFGTINNNVSECILESIQELKKVIELLKNNKK